MKFAVFAFIASLCLVSASAKATGDFLVDNEVVEQYEYIIQQLAEELIEIEPQSIFWIFPALKKIFETLVRINCTIEEILKIQNAAQKLIDDIHKCKCKVSKKVQSLINILKAIDKTIDEIKNLYKDECASVQDDKLSRDNVSSINPSRKCSTKMGFKFLKLTVQIKKALHLIDEIKKVPGDTSKCVLDAIVSYKKYFTDFTANIKACADKK